MLRAVAVVGAFSVLGCVRPELAICGAIACPNGTECASIRVAGETITYCATPEQLAHCFDRRDGEPCETGTCHSGVCLPNACGNALQDANEACDDGNTADRDGCAAACDSDETCANGHVDIATGEACDDGGLRSHDGCASVCATERAWWTHMRDARPGTRTNVALAYDRARRRVVLYGGAVNTTLLDDTLEWDGVQWTRATSTLVPTRSPVAWTAYDSHRETLVMFDGSETWERPADGEWRLIPTTIKPSSAGSQIVYDGARRRVVMVGTATWSWDGIEWSKSELPGFGWAERYNFALGYDARRGVVVAFGGVVSQANVDDVWELQGDTWASRDVAMRPTPRSAPLVFDPNTGTLLLVGGMTEAGEVDEVWSWDGTEWTPRPAVGTRGEYAATTDTTHGRVVAVHSTGIVQEWDGAAWSTVDSPSAEPGPRSAHAMSYDSRRRQLVMFGGRFAEIFADTWTWNGSWRQVTAGGPRGLIGATLVYDERRDEHVLFGGCTSNMAHDETWLFKEGRWTQAMPATSPTPRCYHTSVYDPVRGQVIVHGGFRIVGSANDTWVWDGTNWIDVSSTMRPSGGFGGSLAFDARAGVAVLFGGALGMNEYLDQTWLWNGATWSQAATPLRPPQRFFAMMGWDAARQRILMFGGTNNHSTASDVWEWDGGAWTRTAAQGPPARYGGAMVSALDGAGVLVFGGDNLPASTGGFNDVWLLRSEADPRSELCTDVDSDGDGLAGRADPDCEYRFAPLPTSTCGDGICNRAREACYSCDTDCGACPVVCGNGTCETGESQETCRGDCQ